MVRKNMLEIMIISWKLFIFVPWIFGCFYSFVPFSSVFRFISELNL